MQTKAKFVANHIEKNKGDSVESRLYKVIDLDLLSLSSYLLVQFNDAIFF